MGHSRTPGPSRDGAAGGLVPARTPGSLGKHDAADPNVVGVAGDRPGPTSDAFAAVSGRNNVRLAGAAAGPQPKAAAAAPPPPVTTTHYLVQAGIDRINADRRTYPQKFPNDYYDTLCRHLFEIALDHNDRNYGAAFGVMNDLQNARLGLGLQRHYTQVVGTDTANGWDKVRHFTFTAYLEWNSLGILAPEAFTYGKEVWDQLEYWSHGLLGHDPEGYSVPDVRADNRGEAFAEEMRWRMIAEIKADIAREVRRRWDELVAGLVRGGAHATRAVLREIIRRAIQKFSIPVGPRL